MEKPSSEVSEGTVTKILEASQKEFLDKTIIRDSKEIPTRKLSGLSEENPGKPRPVF